MSLVLDNISKFVARECYVDNVSLELEPGTFNILLGRTLSGKTSLMRMMAGLDRPSSGRLIMNGRDLTGLPVRKRDVAMVYQQFINYPSLTVYKNIASPLRLTRTSATEIDRRVREVAEMLHIDQLLERLPAELSGGQQQRTAIARALVKDTELLLLDEPLVNLDYKLREQLRTEMREIFRQRNSIVVYATTEPLEALALGGNTAVLHQGRLEQFGSTIDVYHYPQTTRIAQAFSDPAMNFVSGTIDGGFLLLGETSRGTPAAHMVGLASRPYQFGMRPSHLRLHKESETDLKFLAQVEIAEISGSETFIHLNHGHHTWTVQQSGVYSYGMGNTVEVFINPARLYVFDQQGQLVAAPKTQ